MKRRPLKRVSPWARQRSAGAGRTHRRGHVLRGRVRPAHRAVRSELYQRGRPAPAAGAPPTSWARTPWAATCSRASSTAGACPCGSVSWPWASPPPSAWSWGSSQAISGALWMRSSCAGWTSLLCFPSFFLILAVIAFLEPSLTNIMIVIGLTGWMGVARLVRAETLSIRERDYVLAARAAGAGARRIIFRHIMPNAMGPVLVSATLGVAGAILTESSLSFLGLGVQPPDASWGNILMEGKEVLGNRLVAVRVPGAGHPADRTRLQPARRVPARPARPKAQAVDPHPPGLGRGRSVHRGDHPRLHARQLRALPARAPISENSRSGPAPPRWPATTRRASAWQRSTARRRAACSSRGITWTTCGSARSSWGRGWARLCSTTPWTAPARRGSTR